MHSFVLRVLLCSGSDSVERMVALRSLILKTHRPLTTDDNHLLEFISQK